MSDEHVDTTLLRISTGIEDVQDLKEDLKQGLLALAAEQKDVVA
jgi:cystathionine beta-lyase/cystathionine gamma-synthase